MKRSVPVSLIAGIMIAIVGLAGYFLVVRPQQAEVKKLDEQIAALETTLDAATKLSQPASETETAASAIQVADIVELAKAMPTVVDMPGIVLELNSVATAAGVTFASITPGPPVSGTGYTATPITLTFDGSYYDLTELLFQLRNLVTVREGVLDATGRLFIIDSVNLLEPEGESFPQVKAELTVSAYQYGVDLAALALAGGTVPVEETSTTGTTTTGDTTTTPATTTTAPATTTAPDQPAAPSQVDVGAQQNQGGGS